MNDTKMLSVQPIAVWQQDEHVIIWHDQPKGWSLLAGFGALPKDGRIHVAKSMVRSYMLNPPNEVHSSVWVVPKSQTSLPADLPVEALVGMHPSLNEPGVPQFTPQNA